MKNKREPGYYRVNIEGQWMIARWTGNVWYFTGIAEEFGDKYHDEIDPTQIDPNPESTDPDKEKSAGLYLGKQFVDYVDQNEQAEQQIIESFKAGWDAKPDPNPAGQMLTDQEIESAIKEIAKKSTAPDKETPDWMESDIRAGMMWMMKRLFPAGQMKWVKASEGNFPTVRKNYFLRHKYKDGRWHGWWSYVVPEAIDKPFWGKLEYEWLDEGN